MAKTAKTSSTLFERRTLTVWAALIGTMTVVAGLLLVLEPSPTAPAPGPVLTVVQSASQGMDTLFATEAPLASKRWRAIVIHHSGQSYGSAETLGARHQAAGHQGLAYHFVIGNGDGAADGEIQTGFRWTKQLPGAHVVTGEQAAWFNHYAVSICLVGNGDRTAPTPTQMEQLVKLVTSLQSRLGIDDDRVYLNSQISPASGPGVLFPASVFRQQLLDLERG